MDYKSYAPFIKVTCIPFTTNSTVGGENRSKYKIESLIKPTVSATIDKKRRKDILESNVCENNLESFKHDQKNERSTSRRCVVGHGVNSSLDRESVSNGQQSKTKNSKRPSSSLVSAHSFQQEKGLDKMRNNLDEIAEKLSYIERKLPKISLKNTKIPDNSSEPRSKNDKSGYDAEEFLETEGTKPADVDYYVKLTNSLADKYNDRVSRSAEVDKKSLVASIRKELDDWRASNSKSICLQTDPAPTSQLKSVSPKRRISPERPEKDTGPSPSSTKTEEPLRSRKNSSTPSSQPSGGSKFEDDGSVDTMDYEYPLDKFLPTNANKVTLNSAGQGLASSRSCSEDPASNLQVIERTAQLLKQVEQHWKKSLFNDNPFLSPKSLSDTYVDSDSDNYVEKLASVRFSNSVHVPHRGSVKQDGSDKLYNALNKRASNSYSDEVKRALSGTSNGRGTRDMSLKKPVMPKPPVANVSRGGASLPRGRQLNIRPHNMLGRPSASSQPRVTWKSDNSLINDGAHKSNQGLDLKFKRPDRLPSPRAVLTETATNTDPPLRNNTLTLNVTEREIPTQKQSKIIVQHLPIVDIRPDLKVQTGPTINITTPSTSSGSPHQPSNMSMVTYVHSDGGSRLAKPYRGFLPYGLDGSNAEYSDLKEESLAAELELRSVAENTLYRINDAGKGRQLLDSLYTVIDLLNKSIDDKMKSGSTGVVTKELPQRMEAVSDMLSDELKSWGDQSTQHYQRLDNIIKHLILDIKLSKGTGSLQNAKDVALDLTSDIEKDKTFCKEMAEPSPKLKASSPSHPNKGQSKAHERKRPGSSVTFYPLARTPRQDLSLEQKLISDKCRKVQQLEKVYSINNQLKLLEELDEEVLKSAAHSAQVDQMTRSNQVDKDAAHSSKSSSGKTSQRSSRSSSRDVTDTADSGGSSYRAEDIPPPLSSDISKSTDKVTSSSSGKPDEIVKYVKKKQKEEGNFESEISEDVTEESGADENVVADSSKSTASSVVGTLRKQSRDETFVVEEEIQEEIPEEIYNQSPSKSGNDKNTEESDYEEDFEADSERPSTIEESKKFFDIPIEAINEQKLLRNDNISKSNASKNYSQSRKLSNEDKICKGERIVSTSADKGGEKLDAHTSAVKVKDDVLGQNSDNIKINPPGLLCNINEVRQDDSVSHRILTVSDPENQTVLEVKLPVTVRSKNKDVEIKLSYVPPNSQSLSQGSHVSGSETNPSKPVVDSGLRKNDKIITRKEKKSCGSVDLKALKTSDDQISKIMAKFNESQFGMLPFPGYLPSVPSVGIQGKPFFSDLGYISSKDGKILCETEMYENSLKSPDVKLKVDGPIVDTQHDKCIAEEPEKISPVASVDSKDGESLVNMVEDLDSSDARSCAASLDQFPDMEPSRLLHDLTLHQFDSDEFIIYPRLHPLPGVYDGSLKNCTEVSEDATGSNAFLNHLLPHPEHAPAKRSDCLEIIQTKERMTQTESMCNKHYDKFCQVEGPEISKATAHLLRSDTIGSKKLSLSDSDQASGIVKTKKQLLTDSDQGSGLVRVEKHLIPDSDPGSGSVRVEKNLISDSDQGSGSVRVEKHLIPDSDQGSGSVMVEKQLLTDSDQGSGSVKIEEQLLTDSNGACSPMEAKYRSLPNLAVASQSIHAGKHFLLDFAKPQASIEAENKSLPDFPLKCSSDSSKKQSSPNADQPSHSLTCSDGIKSGKQSHSDALQLTSSGTIRKPLYPDISRAPGYVKTRKELILSGTRSSRNKSGPGCTRNSFEESSQENVDGYKPVAKPRTRKLHDILPGKEGASDLAVNQGPAESPASRKIVKSQKQCLNSKPENEMIPDACVRSDGIPGSSRIQKVTRGNIIYKPSRSANVKKTANDHNRLCSEEDDYNDDGDDRSWDSSSWSSSSISSSNDSYTEVTCYEVDWPSTDCRGTVLGNMTGRSPSDPAFYLSSSDTSDSSSEVPGIDWMRASVSDDTISDIPRLRHYLHCMNLDKQRNKRSSRYYCPGK